MVQRHLRNQERAAQCYAQALQLRPNFPEALNNMAVIYTFQVGQKPGHALLKLACVQHLATSGWSVISNECETSQLVML